MTAPTEICATMIFSSAPACPPADLAARVGESLQVQTGSAARTCTADHALVHVAAGDVRAMVTLSAGTTETAMVVSMDADEVDADKLKVLLAGLLHHLARELAPDQIVWLDTGTRIPCGTFLDALAPDLSPVPPATPDKVTQIAPRRIKAQPATTRRPRSPQEQLTRMLPDPKATPRPAVANANAEIGETRFDAHVLAYDAHLRATLLREADGAEIDRVRAEQPPIPIEARLSTWAVSISVATVSLPVAAPLMIYNLARGEDLRVASLAMGLAGLFLALDTSGAMAGVLAAL